MNLIYTVLSTDDQIYLNYLYDWVISIKTLGNFKGEILIGECGNQNIDIEKFNKYGVNVINLPERDVRTISNYRNIDMIPILEKYDTNYKFAHFDVDIWFQNDLNPLFDELDNIEGCYFGTEQGRSCGWRGPNDEDMIKEYGDKQNKNNGFIFGGWIAGKYKPYLEKLNKMKNNYNSPGWDTNIWGTDQCMVTYLFDFEKDNSSGDKWGKTFYFCELIEKKWKIKNDIVENYGIQPDITGIHLNNSLNDKSIRYKFRDIHSDIFNNEIKKLI